MREQLLSFYFLKMPYLLSEPDQMFSFLDPPDGKLPLIRCQQIMQIVAEFLYLIMNVFSHSRAAKI